jgi:signal transduction histidine kinase
VNIKTSSSSAYSDHVKDHPLQTKTIVFLTYSCCIVWLELMKPTAIPLIWVMSQNTKWNQLSTWNLQHVIVAVVIAVVIAVIIIIIVVLIRGLCEMNRKKRSKALIEFSSMVVLFYIKNQNDLFYVFWIRIIMVSILVQPI